MPGSSYYRQMTAKALEQTAVVGDVQAEIAVVDPDYLAVRAAGPRKDPRCRHRGIARTLRADDQAARRLA
jgi:hypothetical protein